MLRMRQNSTRRTSDEAIESISMFPDAREMRHQLPELEDKFRKAMINNAQLDNEKQANSYQVDSLKDDMEELEESYSRLQREFKEKHRAHELLQRDYAKLKEDVLLLKECIRQRDHMLQDHGLVLFSNGEISTESESSLDMKCLHKQDSVNDTETGSESGISGSGKQVNGFSSLLSQEAVRLLNDLPGSSLEMKLRANADDREQTDKEMRRLKSELETERVKNRNLDEYELESNLVQELKEANKLMYEYKFKLKGCEQELSATKKNMTRLEGQLERARLDLAQAEQTEDELKADKRKLLRQFRDAQARIEELETSNAHLQKRIDKLKSSRINDINAPVDLEIAKKSEAK